MSSKLLTPEFCFSLKQLVSDHHSVYPRIPPRDIFFEDLVARAFRNIGQTDISLSSPGRSREDMTVNGVRLSIKTETGYGTKPNSISITKLSTTEKAEWVSTALIDRILRHLAEYEVMLMLRSIWCTPPCFHYQLLDIPTSLLEKMRDISVEPTGNRKTKRSLKGSVLVGDDKAFDVFFDATDGKCSIRNLQVSMCTMLKEWDHPVPPEWQGSWPTRTYRTFEKQAKKHVAVVHDGLSSNEGQQLDLFSS